MFKKSHKSFLALALTFVFAFSLFAAPVFASDIEGHWAEPELAFWSDLGLLYGYEDGTYKPDNAITRAEFVALTNRVTGFVYETEDNFADVEGTEWYAADLATAKALGYISGYPDGSFKPNAAISRQEVAVVLYRLLELVELEDKTALESFTDANLIADWSKEQINAIATFGYMVGYTDGEFKPEAKATRAQAVAVLDRALADEILAMIGTFPVLQQATVNTDVYTVQDDFLALEYTQEGFNAIDTLKLTFDSAAPTVTGAVYFQVDGVEVEEALGTVVNASEITLDLAALRAKYNGQLPVGEYVFIVSVINDKGFEAPYFVAVTVTQ